MSNNNDSTEQMEFVPNKKERLAGALLYLFPYLGEFGFGIMAAFGLITYTTDLPYFLRFHFSNATRNGILGLPVALLILAPVVIDVAITPVSNFVMYSFFAFAGLFALAFIAIDIYCMVYAAKGQMRQVVPGKVRV